MAAWQNKGKLYRQRHIQQGKHTLQAETEVENMIQEKTLTVRKTQNGRDTNKSKKKKYRLRYKQQCKETV